MQGFMTNGNKELLIWRKVGKVGDLLAVGVALYEVPRSSSGPDPVLKDLRTFVEICDPKTEKSTFLSREGLKILMETLERAERVMDELEKGGSS